MSNSNTWQKVLAGFLVLILLVVIFFYVPFIPKKVTEPYEDIEIYWELEEYIEQVPYTIEVEITLTETVVEHLFELKSVTFKTFDFTLHKSETVTIDWHSSKEVTMFAIVKQSTWDNLWLALVTELGVSVVIAIWSGTSATPAIIASLPVVLTATMASIASGDYYVITSNGDITNKNMMSGQYKLAVMSFGESGILDSSVTYDYETTETQIRFRNETRYKNVTKTRPVTKYREVKKKITFWQSITGNY